MEAVYLNEKIFRGYSRKSPSNSESRTTGEVLFLRRMRAVVMLTTFLGDRVPLRLWPEQTQQLTPRSTWQRQRSNTWEKLQEQHCYFHNHTLDLPRIRQIKLRQTVVILGCLLSCPLTSHGGDMAFFVAVDRKIVLLERLKGWGIH